MLLRAAQERNLELSRSYLIGDAASDIQAAIAAGCYPILVLTGRGTDQLEQLPPNLRSVCAILPDISTAIDWIIKNHNP